MRKVVHDGICLIVVVLLGGAATATFVRRIGPASRPRRTPAAAEQIEFYRTRHPSPATQPWAEDVAAFYEEHHPASR